MPITDEEWGQLREDVGYIRSTLEVRGTILEDHEQRIRKIEQRWWAFPVTAIIALLGSHFPGSK